MGTVCIVCCLPRPVKMAWLYIVLTIAAALFFYWLRCRWLAWYAFSEIMVALLLIYLAFFPHTNYLLINGGGFWDTVLTEPVKIFAGIYAFVRGCDNIVTGLRNPIDF
jgi:ABC-type transport system involved in cytochrome c biogenesis permease subunit